MKKTNDTDAIGIPQATQSIGQSAYMILHIEGKGILFTIRDQGFYKGWHEFPGGAPEEGESQQEAAIREFWEEQPHFKVTKAQKIGEFEQKTGFSTHLFIATKWEQFPHEQEEGLSAEFLTFQEIERLRIQEKITAASYHMFHHFLWWLKDGEQRTGLLRNDPGTPLTNLNGTRNGTY